MILVVGRCWRVGSYLVLLHDVARLVTVSDCTFAMALVILPFTLIFITIGVNVSSLAVHLAVQPVADVSNRVGQVALACHDIAHTCRRRRK